MCVVGRYQVFLWKLVHGGWHKFFNDFKVNSFSSERFCQHFFAIGIVALAVFIMYTYQACMLLWRLRRFKLFSWWLLASISGIPNFWVFSALFTFNRLHTDFWFMPIGLNSAAAFLFHNRIEVQVEGSLLFTTLARDQRDFVYKFVKGGLLF